MRPEFSHRFAGLNEKRFIVFELPQRPNDSIERFPASRGTTRSSINDEPVRSFGHIWVEIVHEHSHGRLLMPAFAASFGTTRRMDDLFLRHISSKRPLRISLAAHYISLEIGRSCVSVGTN